MKLTSSIYAALAISVASFSASAAVVSVATGAQGSLAFSSGQAVAKVLNDNGITARTQPLVGYLPLINSGEVDFGFSNGVEAGYAFTGTGNYDRKHPNMRLVGVMFPLSTGIMAPCDLGLKTIADVKARSKNLKIASEYKSSTIIPYYIAGGLASGGLTYEDFQQVPVASFVDGIKALGDGLVDLALVSLNNGAGKKAAVKLKDRGGLCYVSLNGDANGVAAFKEYLPAGVLKPFKQNEKLNGLAGSGATLMQIPWVMMTNADVSDELVYSAVKAIAENKESLVKALGLFRGANKETMAPSNDMPYHPGALKYFKEAGISVGQ